MEEKTSYFVLKEKAVPDVLLRVVEAKRLLESEKVASVQEAAERVGISRSSFYKYKDDIFLSMKTVKERPSRWFFRWMMSRGFCLSYSGPWQNIMPIY